MKSSVASAGQNYRHSIEDIKEYGIFMLDTKARVSSWGKGAQHHLGYKESEAMGKNFLSFFRDSEIINRTTKTALKVTVAKGAHLYQEQCVRKNGKSFWSSIALTAILNKEGKHQGYSVILRDTTEQVNTHNIRLHQSMHDYLTGLPNRRYLEECLKEAIQKSQKKMLLGVLFLDFNNFKRVNNFGHKYGDLVLVAIANRLKENIRKEDIVSRLGGDEFVIVLKGFKHREDIKRATENTLRLFKKTIIVGKKKFNISVSIGVAVYPTAGRNAEELLHHADMALYQAKKMGGNRYELYVKKSATAH